MRQALLVVGMATAWAVVAGPTLAQRPATAVQLPTYSMFTTSTTVSVPDRGNVLLGGINRAATGRNEFGTPLSPFRNTGIGMDRSASSVRVSAFIHDFEAMEEALMSQPSTARQWSGYRPMPRGQAAALAHTVQPRAASSLQSTWQVAAPVAAEQAATSLAEAQSRRALQEQTRAGEALDFYQRGEAAEAAGKANVARIYYQMAARRAEGELKDRVAAKLETISRGQTGTQYAGSGP